MFSLTAILINVVVAAMKVPQEYSDVLTIFLIILNIVVLVIIAGIVNITDFVFHNVTLINIGGNPREVKEPHTFSI